MLIAKRLVRWLQKSALTVRRNLQGAKGVRYADEVVTLKETKKK